MSIISKDFELSCLQNTFVLRFPYDKKLKRFFVLAFFVETHKYVQTWRLFEEAYRVDALYPEGAWME